MPASSVSFQPDITDTAASSPSVYVQGTKDASRQAASVGYQANATGTYGLRLQQGTPGVVCTLEIFGGGLELGDEATTESSIPTPGDARGSFTVGARDWQGDAAADYSSQGPTEDGRLKPDAVAPASTAVWPGRRDGRHLGLGAARSRRRGAAHAARSSGGTAERSRHDRQGADRQRARHRPGQPGRGHGRGPHPARSRPPTWVSTAPSAGQPVGDSARFDIDVDDAGTIEASGVSIDGAVAAEVEGILHRRLDTSALAPGPHTALFWARDMAGNRCRAGGAVRPRLHRADPGALLERKRTGGGRSPTRSRARGSLAVQIDDPTGALHVQRTLPLTFAAGQRQGARRRADAGARPGPCTCAGVRRGRAPVGRRLRRAGARAAMRRTRSDALGRRIARSLLPPAVVLDVSFVNGLEAIRSLAAAGAPVIAVDHRGRARWASARAWRITRWRPIPRTGRPTSPSWQSCAEQSLLGARRGLPDA